MYEYLSGRLRHLGLTQSDIGIALGLCSTAISHRMTGKTAWTIDEMYKVLEICRGRPDELHIYFPPKGTAGKHFAEVASSPVMDPPLYLVVRIEQPTTENLQISCQVQSEIPHSKRLPRGELQKLRQL